MINRKCGNTFHIFFLFQNKARRSPRRNALEEDRHVMLATARFDQVGLGVDSRASIIPRLGSRGKANGIGMLFRVGKWALWMDTLPTT